MKGFDFEHLKKARENYFEHFVHALTYSFKFAKCSLFCVFHAIFPFFLVDYASKQACEIVSHVKARQGEENARKEKKE